MLVYGRWLLRLNDQVSRFAKRAESCTSRQIEQRKTTVFRLRAMERVCKLTEQRKLPLSQKKQIDWFRQIIFFCIGESAEHPVCCLWTEIAPHPLIHTPTHLTASSTYFEHVACSQFLLHIRMQFPRRVKSKSKDLFQQLPCNCCVILVQNNSQTSYSFDIRRVGWRENHPV